MAAIHDLLAQVQDEALKVRLEQEINRLSKAKKFGLVFEEHLPECTPLYDIPVKSGSMVAKKNGAVSDMYEVAFIKDDVATCYHKITQEKEEIPVNELVCVAQFGEPIYPYLKPIDSVCNAPDSNLWHTLIEADNYHALQLLEYLYAGKVDCIYIDPPYNTGAKDWKYNNDYVDGTDAYRHSKWLSMMEKRLKLAKKLLNPENSIMMITIDDIELCHLKILLESLFSECYIQIIDMVINPKGKARVGKLSQVDEYLILIYMGNAKTCSVKNAECDQEVRWPYLRRSDVESARGTIKGGTQQFYPIYVDKKTEKIVEIGDFLTPDQPLTDSKTVEGAVAVFPIRDDGKHMNWGLTEKSLRYALENDCVRVTKSNNKYQPYNFTYVTIPSIQKALSGEYIVAGKRKDGTKTIMIPHATQHQRPTAWKGNQYDANAYGTKLIGKFWNDKRFSFPKSLYSVVDALNIYLADKKEALVIDFFAGSGTTLHALNLLNAVDNGSRRCVMVTNNEVSETEARNLIQKGYNPGDREWEKLGIANYVTWTRTVCAIKGIDVDGNPLHGNYGCDLETYLEIDGEVMDPSTGKKIRGKVYKKTKTAVYPEFENMKFSDGFKTNAVFFKLGFLDKNAVALGNQLAELIPVLWLKAGARGSCPSLIDADSVMMIQPENQFAILIDEKQFSIFEEELKKYPEIQTIYFVTDSDSGYREMIKGYKDKETYQLYRDYLDNFRINTRR